MVCVLLHLPGRRLGFVSSISESHPDVAFSSCMHLIPKTCCGIHLAERLDLSKPRYDQSTYLGRCKHMFEVTDPRTILASDKGKSGHELLWGVHVCSLTSF